MEAEMQEPIVDYFSFSIDAPQVWDGYKYCMENKLPYNTHKRIKRAMNMMQEAGEPFVYGGKGVFDRHLHFPQAGFSYFDGQKSNVSLIQVTGQGCEILRIAGQLQHLLHDWQDRATRIDVAVDIKTNCSVEGFSRSRSNQKFKSASHILSGKGETWYIGGKNSDRHARVYRYNPPSPRCDFLRIEYELHDMEAKRTTRDILERDVSTLAWDLGKTWGWTHEDYLPPASGEKLRSLSRPANYSNTAHWLRTDVASACEKMARRGEFESLVAFESILRGIIEEYSSHKE